MSSLSLNPQKMALVAIDLQYAVVSTNTAPHSALEVVDKNRQIAEALRAKDGLVVWVRVDRNKFMRLPVDRPPPFGQETPEELWQIAPSSGFQAGDALITKKHWGAFAQTRMQSTLRQGTGPGFAFIAVEDACSGLCAEGHRFAFAKIFPRLARVRTTEEVLKALA